MIDPKTFNFVAQMSHIFFGSTLTLATVLFWNPHGLFYLLPAYAIITGIKEFYWDQKYEDADTRGSNLLDFSLSQLGEYVSLGLYLLKGSL